MPNIFSKIFNGKLKRGIKTNTFSKANKTYLREFLKSGIGFGYTVVHKLSNEIKVFKMTKQKMEQTATPLSCDIFYGGKTGTGKRIDMEKMVRKLEELTGERFIENA